MRILIVKLSSLGDVIHCLPCLHALKFGFPEAKIDWLVEEQNAGILEGHPYIDHLILFKRKSWMRRPWQIGKVFRGLSGFVKDLRSQYYDLVIDFQGLFRSGILVGFSRGMRKIGFDKVREMAHIFYNEKVRLSTLHQHAVTRYLEIPQYLGISVGEPQFFLPVSRHEEEIAHKLLEDIGLKEYKNKRIIYINPNARWPSKIWPWERFRQLIQALSLKGNEVVLIGGLRDQIKMDKAFHGLGERVYNLAGQTSLKSLTALFKKGNCLITNDSGPMHLAVAVGLPVVAIFGPSNPLRTGPFGWQKENKQNRVIWGKEPCAPCYKKKCPHQTCLMEVSMEEVLDAVREALEFSAQKSKDGIYRDGT